MKLSIGIDFGAIYSTLAFFDEGTARVLSTVPSARTEFPAAKRLLERVCSALPDDVMAWEDVFESPLRLGAKRYILGQICVSVLSQLRAEAKDCLGNEVDRCAISVPARSSLAYQILLRQSAIKAGFKWVDLVSELQAATWDLMPLLSGEEKYVLIFDMSGANTQAKVDQERS